MRRREFMNGFLRVVEAGGWGGVVGCGIDASLNGSPEWASREFGVSVEAGAKIEKHAMNVAILSGGAASLVSWFSCHHTFYQPSNATKANPAVGGPRP